MRAAEHGYDELISRTAVLAAASRKLQTIGSRRRGASLETLQKAWDRYECVAHLWAAERPRYWNLDAEIFALHLSAAEQIRQRGEALIPRHGLEPVLNPQRMWRAPASFSLPDVPLRIDPPDAEELAMFDRLN